MRRTLLLATLSVWAASASAQSAEEPPPAEEKPAAPEVVAEPPAAPSAVPDAGPPKRRRRPDAGTEAPKLAEDAGRKEPVLDAGAPKPRPVPDAGAPPIAVAPPQVPSNLPPEAQAALATARTFFAGLAAADARAAAAVSTFPFQLDEKRLASSDDLVQELLKDLRDKRTDLVTLYGIEMLTPADMEKKYGKPPARLVNFPWKTPGTWIAVANLSGHAAVALLRPGAGGWRVAGYHD